MTQKKCQSSMSRKGNPYDNALMASFYKTLKRELVNDAHFASIEQANLKSLNILNLLQSETYPLGLGVSITNRV